jgi:hypothetical protein
VLSGPSIAVLLGDGKGGFTPAPGSPHQVSLARPYGIASGDLDRDGTTDLVVAHDDTDRVSVLLGDGAGGLRSAPGSPVSFGSRALDYGQGAPGAGAIVDATGWRTARRGVKVDRAWQSQRTSASS